MRFKNALDHNINEYNLEKGMVKTASKHKNIQGKKRTGMISKTQEVIT